jgi:hypothetical protein
MGEDLNHEHADTDGSIALVIGQRPLTWRRPLSLVLDRAIAAYQRWLSPLLPPACRFHPSCSQYARTSLAEHRLHRALGLICWRLLRCQPLCAGGHDPVPPSNPGPSREPFAHTIVTP